MLTNNACLQVLLEVEDALTKSQDKVKLWNCNFTTSPPKDIPFGVIEKLNVALQFFSGGLGNN